MILLHDNYWFCNGHFCLHLPLILFGYFAGIAIFIGIFVYFRRYKKNRSTTDKHEAMHQNKRQFNREDQIEIGSETV